MGKETGCRNIAHKIPLFYWKKKMVYQIKCAWCGKKIGTKEGAEDSLALKMETQEGIPIISHGICEACKKEDMDEIPDYNPILNR